MFAPRGWVRGPGTRRIYRVLKASNMFDPGWYRRYQAPGLAKLSDPVWHYMDYGAMAGLDPSAHFDTSYYREQYYDVRESRLNPLFHYLEYGMAERRSPMRSALQTFTQLFPDAADLPLFITPQVGPRRLSVVFDTFTDLVDSSMISALSAAVALAKSEGRTIRVIQTTSSGLSVAEVVASLTADAQTIEVARLDRLDTSASVPMFPDETFVATSWTSAAALRFTGRPALVAHSSGLYPLDSHGWRSLAGARLAEEGHTRVSLPRAGRSGLVPRSPGVTRLVIFADPDVAPATYALSLLDIESWIFERGYPLRDLSLAVCGAHVRPIRLAGGVNATIYNRVPGEILGDIDLAIVCVNDDHLVAALRSHGTTVYPAFELLSHSPTQQETIFHALDVVSRKTGG